MDDFVDYPLVERVLGHGDTKSSVLLQGGFQADLRLVAAESRGAAMQYFTGSKAHNIALRDRADRSRVQAERVRPVSRRRRRAASPASARRTSTRRSASTWVPPELREMRGEIEAAAAARAAAPRSSVADLRGDLHMHTTETDGKDDIGTMAAAARDGGLDYIAITDHSQSLAMANGLDERRAIAHAERIRAVDAEGLGIRLLAGVECDIMADGSLDLADDCLAALDIVVASVHSAFNQERQEMTDRVLRAIENPHVDILGHPTGRKLSEASGLSDRCRSGASTPRRAPASAVEINSQPHRLDLNDVHARLARERGVPIVISSDSHSRHALRLPALGRAAVARRAWLQPADVLNTRPFDEFRASLRRHRRPRS